MMSDSDLSKFLDLLNQKGVTLFKRTEPDGAVWEVRLKQKEVFDSTKDPLTGITNDDIPCHCGHPFSGHGPQGLCSHGCPPMKCLSPEELKELEEEEKAK